MEMWTYSQLEASSAVLARCSQKLGQYSLRTKPRASRCSLCCFAREQCPRTIAYFAAWSADFARIGAKIPT